MQFPQSPPMRLTRLDHLVLTTSDLERCCAFYTQVLGMDRIQFGEGRLALTFGQQKINLHPVGQAWQPRAALPTPGSLDLCFVVEDPLKDVIDHLERQGIPIVAGPVARTGALGGIQSVYIRDPDGNLIELARYGFGADGVET